MSGMALTTRLRELIAIWPRSWTLLLVICVLVMGAVDAALLELGKTYFSGGYNGVYIDRLPQLLGFFASSALLDIGFVLGIWALLLPIVGRLRFTGLRRLALVGIITLAIPLSIDYANYTLHHILGDMVAVALLWEVSGRSATEMAAQALPHLHPMAFGLLIASVGGLLALRVAGWLEARFGRDPFSSSPPGVGAVWIGFLAAVATSASLLVAARATAPRIHVVECDVRLPRMEVWRALIDASTWNEWFPGVRSASYRGSPPHGVGTVPNADVSGRFFEETMLAWDEGRRFAGPCRRDC